MNNIQSVADITGDTDFDSGDADSVNVSGNPINVSVREKHNSQERNYTIRLQNIMGRSRDIFVDTESQALGVGPNRLFATYAEKASTKDWRDFDSVSIDGDGRITATLGRPFHTNTVFFGRWRLHPAHRIDMLVRAWLAHPHVSPSAVSDARCVFHRLPPVTSNSGRSVPELDMYALKITNPSSTNDKNQILITGGCHPHEYPGHWAMEGAVNFLISSHPDAVLLREWSEVYVLPDVAPQSRYAGKHRGSVYHGDDNNRVWNDSSPGAEVEQTRSAITNLLNECDAHLDFHSFGNDNWNNLWYTAIDMGAPKGSKFESVMQNLDSNFNFESVSLSSGTLTGWTTSTFGSELVLCVIPEVTPANTERVDNYLSFGERNIIAIASMISENDFRYGPSN